jgi:small subunit ribosomal protein S7
MPRRYKPTRRIPAPDPVFNDIEVSKFINRLMLRGKKSVAERIFYQALDVLDKKVPNEKPLDVFHTAVKKVTPLVEVKARRVGGSTYQVPVEVRPDRGKALATGWIIKFANQRSGRSLKEKLAEELLSAYRGEGLAVKKKDDTHKMAEANKAFAHYRY